MKFRFASFLTGILFLSGAILSGCDWHFNEVLDSCTKLPSNCAAPTIIKIDDTDLSVQGAPVHIVLDRPLASIEKLAVVLVQGSKTLPLTTALNQQDHTDELANATVVQLQDFQAGPAQLQITYHANKIVDGAMQDVQTLYPLQRVILK